MRKKLKGLVMFRLRRESWEKDMSIVGCECLKVLFQGLGKVLFKLQRGEQNKRSNSEASKGQV